MNPATLLVVSGPGRGTRFELPTDGGPSVIGRSVGSRIRIDDTEVSRRHAQVQIEGETFRIVDLGSANGLFVNGTRLKEATLRHGDTIRLGATVLAFQQPGSAEQWTAQGQVRLVDDAAAPHSAIVQHVRADTGSSIAVWPAQRLGLELLHQVAEELVRPTHSLESLLQRILQLTVAAVRADNGCILLRDPVGGELTPFVYWQRADRHSSPSEADADGSRMCIPRSITGHVIQHGRAVRTSNAANDSRFAGQSVVTSNIREAICAPMQGQGQLLGVVYVDIISDQGEPVPDISTGRMTDEHLKSVLAVARQAALAVESRQFQDALLKAERFAAMGQTVAVLSHHIKNILQGIRGGGYLIQTGLKQSQEEFIRQGWGIVERNQNRIYDLVMDMLSFSRDRVPELQTGSVNELCEEVMELANGSAVENHVRLEFRPEASLPPAEFDHEGIHRALLNIVINAIDAVSELADGQVVLQTGYDRTNDVMLIAVTDNGPGIPEDQRAGVFQVFESSKGSRGTGIGLAVSRKILREHGGRIRIEGEPGEGARFVLSWPRGNPKSETVRLPPGERRE
ncbi:MAG: ATP-binding protein [Planctomycetaceae bacterium]